MPIFAASQTEIERPRTLTFALTSGNDGQIICIQTK
jgi:hypothetical protein